ncbi:TniQ family protein [Microbacterium aerolatum]|uniref:TniQ domain-containing protein n=1 Tax=Microbacterium aerolatum TaxID=153731 RepID=A0A511AIE8_9MICO|nr:TniQ family protein [Microbacterium aerolatum]GEK87909.1 hypothetical protein MAE01_30850 [Microbacterium aerolatum]GGB22171.1 hypothetical protein GCM10007198_10800 [Microbacterium aerolatum]
MTAELRRLPFVVRPLPDEPFGSWFETMAATLRTTCGDLARALGLRVLAQGPLGSTSWSVQLDDQQLANLERTTGLTSEVLRATTREGFAANAVQFDRRGAISLFSPISGASGRYCPDCLRDSNGRWRLTWQFPFGFACVRHHRLLNDVCAACRKPPHRTALPHRLVPMPGACRNPIGRLDNGRVRPCGADLRDDHSDAMDAGADVLDAQRLIMRALSKPRTADGIWSSGPQPASRVLGDLVLLAGFARRDLEERGPDESRTSSGGAGAIHRASAYAVACRAVHDTALLNELFRDNVNVNTSYDGLSPQMQTLIASTRGTKRRATFVLQTAFDGGDAAARAAKIPALLWPEWTAHLAPRRVDRTIAAAALSAAIVLAGSRLTHAASLGLIDREAPSRRVTNVMRSLGRSGAETETLPTILQLAQFLDAVDTPIDYSRRRSLDYTELLQPEEWERIAIAHNVHSGFPRRAVLARAHVHRLLSGDRVQRLSPLDGAPELVTDSELHGFTRNAPSRVLSALEEVAALYLDGLGIEEPVTWHPTPSALGLAPFEPDRAGARKWVARRPVRGASGGPKHVAISAAYDEGLSIRATAVKLGLSRQTVARTRDAHGIPSRPGRQPRFHVDIEWLREQYETERRTAVSIARELGCSPTTIRRHLRAAGLTHGAT